MKHYALKNCSPKRHVQEEVNNATSFMLGFDEWYGKCYRSGGGGGDRERFWRVGKGLHPATTLGKRRL